MDSTLWMVAYRYVSPGLLSHFFCACYSAFTSGLFIISAAVAMGNGCKQFVPPVHGAFTRRLSVRLHGLKLNTNKYMYKNIHAPPVKSIAVSLLAFHARVLPSLEQTPFPPRRLFSFISSLPPPASLPPSPSVWMRPRMSLDLCVSVCVFSCFCRIRLVFTRTTCSCQKNALMRIKKSLFGAMTEGLFWASSSSAAAASLPGRVGRVFLQT